MKRVSILKESLPGERRVILLPDNLNGFVNDGFEILVERGAGTGLGIPDSRYELAGARIVSTEEAWTKSDYVLKYKCPTPEEYRWFGSSLTLGAFFHAEGNPDLVSALTRNKVTSYSYELFKTKDGLYPMNVASSEIAGKQAILYAAYHLQTHFGGSGTLLCKVSGCNPPKVVILGYGNAGGSAARTAAALGADVLVLGTNRARLRRFLATVPASVRGAMISPEVLAQELPDADALVGAILVSTFDTPAIITEEHLAVMKPGSIIVDITCGYGPGYLPTFDTFTTFADPIFLKYGILHCKIKTLPSSVPQTTNQAMSYVVSPYLVELGNSLYSGFSDPVSRSGKITDKGVIVHSEVERHMAYWAWATS